MSADLTQTVKVKVEGNTAPARAAMQALAQETKKTKSAFDQMRDGFGKNVDSVVTGLGKLHFAVAGVGTMIDGIATAASWAKLSAEMRNMEKNLPVGALQMMQKATDGTVSKIDLLRLKHLAISAHHAPASWMHGPELVDHVRAGWRTVRVWNEWIAENLPTAVEASR